MSTGSTSSSCEVPSAPVTSDGFQAGEDIRGGLLSRSFLGLVVTQFLGAMNDNMFRWLVVPIGKHIVGPEKAAVALSVGLACFVLPYIFLAAYAGYLADRFSKQKVIVYCKVAEVLIMALGVAAILINDIYAMFVVVALMGIQSALFGPSKFGSIPQIVRSRHISAANGIIGMTTVMAVVAGTVAGNMLYDLTGPRGVDRWWLSALALLGVAGVGWAASLLIARLPSANPSRSLPRDPVGQTVRDLATLAASKPLLRAAFGLAFFWAVAALCQVNVDVFALEELAVGQQKYVGLLLGVLALGVAVGSVLAGIWSRGKVELGIVPLGAAGIAASAMLLFSVPVAVNPPFSGAFCWTRLWLFTLGLGAGLFNIPIESFLQHRSPEKTRGVILAATNFITFSAMLLAAGLFWVFRDLLGLSARQVFLLAGLATLPVLAYVLWLLPGATIRFLVWLASRTVYRIRVEGLDNIPEKGGALLIPNHVTWADGVLLLISSPRPVRMIAYADHIQGWWVRWLAREMGAIPITPGRRSVVQSIRSARDALRQGDLVCIFPEGGLTRTGELQEFRPGFLSILKDTDAPAIPVYLGGLWGSIFSFERGRFFWKWPRRWPYPLSILFGSPIHRPSGTNPVRQAVEQLGSKAMQQRQRETITPPQTFLRNCRRSLRRAKVADSTGAELSGGGLLTRTLILRRLLRRRVLADDEKHVGLLLPPSVGAVVANAALSIDRRVAVNLNYTVSSEVMNLCIARCGVRHVLTSRRVMERLQLDIDAELVYLEDFKDEVRFADKLVCGLATWLLPAALLERLLGIAHLDPDDVLTVIFTSGSTGDPKGVMLSHRNVGTNVEALDHIIHLRKSDVLVGILPLFHSFGYTTTMWTVLALEPMGVYHTSPLEPREVGKLCRRHKVTIMISTPTFVRSYLRRCTKEDFTALDVVFTGAERLPADLADAFENKFGVRPVEGYGTTELSPVVAGNIPPSRALDSARTGCKEGTVGKPIPGVLAKVVDLDTGEDLGTDKSGMLLIKGPNVMKGYFGQQELTAEVVRNGWYTTGDVAVIDAEGFIRITGRQSRFSKIGGEMVPHIRVEEAIGELVASDSGELRAVVTAVPDAKRGERLIVLHTGVERAPEDICRELGQAGLPPIWIPSPDSYRQVEEIPVLGTGKLDLKRLKQLAEELFLARG